MKTRNFRIGYKAQEVAAQQDKFFKQSLRLAQVTLDTDIGVYVDWELFINKATEILNVEIYYKGVVQMFAKIILSRANGGRWEVWYRSVQGRALHLVHSGNSLHDALIAADVAANIRWWSNDL